jgi:hypothetical protein
MLFTMTVVSAIIAAAADVVWKSRDDADLRRRWRARDRHAWRSTRSMARWSR